MLDSFLIADAIIGKSETLENFKKDGRLSINTKEEIEISKYSVFILATFSWIMQEDKTSSKYFEILQELYLSYPNTNSRKYGKGLSHWLSKPLEYLRISYDGSCLPQAIFLGLVAINTDELKMLVTELTKTTHNTSEAIEASYTAAYFAYLCKNLKSKNVIFEELKNNFSYSPQNIQEDNKQNYVHIGNANRILQTALDVIYISDSYIDALNNALTLKIEKDIIFSTVSILAACLYKVVPMYLKAVTNSRLPNEVFKIKENFKKFLVDNKEKYNILFPII